jgi:putative ABC transport system ATP-binding protein
MNESSVSASGVATAVPEQDSVVQMRGISKVYDTGKIKVEALLDIDLDVTDGEFLSVVGPSGSGKSTLMNLIGCLDTPTSGTYDLRGQSVAGMSRADLADVRNRHIGFVFQNFNLIPQISTFENIEMPLLFGRVGKKDRKQRVEELLERVGLADRGHHKPTELSGGQMQRVAVARALSMRPALLLADEPTGNLDSSSGGDIMDLFQELWEHGHTMIVITHDLALAKRTSRRIELHDGRITSDVRNGQPSAGLTESLA